MGGVRVLIVSADSPGIDSVREVRFIQGIHHTSLLHGTVTEADIFAVCRDTAFDIIHFASHGGPEGVQLSNGEIMDANSIATVARLRETEGLIFNSCEAAVLANYAVRHGVRWALSADGVLENDDAWKLPAAFYGALRNGHSRDIVGAFILADGGDGKYGLRWNPLYIQELQRAAALAATIPHAARPLSRQEAAIWAVLLTLGAAGLTAALLFAAGRL